MELRFDVMLCSNTGKENSDAAKSNVQARRRFPAPDLRHQLHTSTSRSRIG